MPRQAAVISALIVLLICGVVHGWWAERWHKSRALEDALAQVELVPMNFGAWKAEPVEGDPEAFRIAGAQAYWMRSYTNAKQHNAKQHKVLAILMCGRAGRMAVHTPEIAFQGDRFELHDGPSATLVRGESGEELGTFNTARFTRTAGGRGGLRLYWSWNPGDGWQTPSSPRWTFGGKPFLYKLYVSQAPTSGSDRDAAAELLRDLLPELRKTLAAASP